MKKIFLFAIIVSASFSLRAQTSANESLFSSPQSGSFLNRFENKELRIAHKLKLDANQLKSLDDINDTYVTQVASLYDNKTLSKKERHEKINALKSLRRQNFINMLTPDQHQQWQEMRKSKQKKVFRKK